MKECHWLWKQDKWLPIPEIIIDECPALTAGGLYYRPADTELFWHNRYYPMNKGVIFVNVTNSHTVETTLAHEWRHHYQAHSGFDFSGCWSTPTFEKLFQQLPYEKALFHYFQSDVLELDALRFQHKMAGIADYWEDVLHPLLSN